MAIDPGKNRPICGVSMSQLQHSMFHDVFFPSEDDADSQGMQSFSLRKVLRYTPSAGMPISDVPLVIFDFETTGLDTLQDQIIEIGGLKIEQGKPTQEFSALIKPNLPLTEVITKITGITEDMLADKPAIEAVLPDFLRFIDGCVLVAHNAEFDMAFLRNQAERMGYLLEWPCFCTLKMARQLLPDLESKNLDTLAEHYGLTFEARHRSIGDCKVTSAVLQAFLSEEGKDLKQWQDFQAFAVN